MPARSSVREMGRLNQPKAGVGSGPYSSECTFSPSASYSSCSMASPPPCWCHDSSVMPSIPKAGPLPHSPRAGWRMASRLSTRWAASSLPRDTAPDSASVGTSRPAGSTSSCSRPSVIVPSTSANVVMYA